MNIIDSKIGEWRQLDSDLREYRAKVFPAGTRVWVKCDRYKGAGIVRGDAQCPPDQIPIEIPNGNTWWYPIQSVTVK